MIYYIFVTFILTAGYNPAVDSSDTTIIKDTIKVKYTKTVKDPWLSQDKFLHFSACAALTGLTYHLYVCRWKRDEHLGRVYAVPLTAVLSLSKEIYDKKKKGQFSWRDLCWDGLGLLAGYLLFIY